MSGSRRRRTSALLTVAGLLGAAVLTACSSDEPPKPPTTETVEGPALLTFSVYGPAPVVTAYAKIAAAFTAANPDVVVNVRPFDDHEESHEALTDAPPSVRGPDIFLAERSDLSFLMQDDRIQRVDGLLGERGVDFGDGFQREALEAFSADNALQCMPVDTSPLVVYYNTRLVDLSTLAGPGEKAVTADSGWNMDQFAAAARQSSRGRFRGLYVEPSLEQIAPFVWSGGGHMIDSLTEPTTLTLSDGDSEEALKRMLELVRDPRVTFTKRQIDRVPALTRFKAGRLAMILGYRDLTPQLRGAPTLSFDVMPIPRAERRGTAGTMRGLCISGGTEHAEEAADFIAYAVSDEATQTLTSTGFVTPTNLDVSNSEVFLQPGEQPANPQVFTRAVRYIQRLPVGDGWDQVAEQAKVPLTRLFYDPVIDPLSERLEAIDAQSARILARFATPSESPSPSPTE